MAQHPRSVRAYSHNAMRGSVIRMQRGNAWLLSRITVSDATTPRAKNLAIQIDQLMFELGNELKTRVDP